MRVDYRVANERSDQQKSRSGTFHWGCGSGGGCGCASLLVVLTVGLALSLFNTNVGLGFSVRIPLTESNLTVAGSVGVKEKATETLPRYVKGRLSGNQNFVNQSTTLTIGPAEGAALIVLGKQDGAPLVDLHFEAL